MAGATASVPILTSVGAAFIACGMGAGIMAPHFADAWMGAGSFISTRRALRIVLCRRHQPLLSQETNEKRVNWFQAARPANRRAWGD